MRRCWLVSMVVLVSWWVPGTARATRLTSAPARALGFLRVGAPGGPVSLPQILDDQGRQVLLKGVNVDGLVDYWRPDLRRSYPIDPAAYDAGHCPPDDPTVEGVMVCGFDFSQMHPLGFNVVRLNLSWSLLEPTPGQIDSVYLSRIAQVVAWARAQGIYVLLDLHQDAWSKYVYTRAGQVCVPPTRAVRGYDGAPAWASLYTSPACATNGVRELDPAVQEQFQKLYADAAGPDGVGLQEHYAHALAVLGARFAAEPAVAGYEIINEPSPGFNAVPSESDATQLFPFYAKVIRTVIHDVPGFRQLFFIEPNTERDVTDQSAIGTPWSAYSSYPNVVYAPHIYTGVFTVDQQVASRRFFPSDGGYNSAISDARALGLALWVGEFGNNPADDETLLRTSYALQDRDGLGGALWLWKENANDVNGSVFWGIYGRPFGAGVAQPRRIKFVDRAYPLVVAGNLRRLSFDPDHLSFDLRASSAPVAFGDRAHATVIFIPASVLGDVHATRARLEVFARGPAREAYVYPTGGDYHVYLLGSPGTPSSTGAGGGAVGLGLRAPRSCASRRRLVIHLMARRGVRILGVRVGLTGGPPTVRGLRRRARSIRIRGLGRGRRAIVDLRGLPRGTFRLRLTIRIRTRGRTRTISSVHAYHTCVPGRRRPRRGKGRAHARARRTPSHVRSR